MGHLTPVLVATEAFGRDMHKTLLRHRASPELCRELEQNFTIWKSSIRQFHDAASPHTSLSRNNFVKASALAEWIGSKVASEIVEDVCDNQIPQLEIQNANRKLAEANEKIRILETKVRQSDANNTVIKAQNDRQADAQLTLAHSMFEEVFQLRTTITELTAIALDDTGTLAEKYERESQKVRYQRNRADSLFNKTTGGEQNQNHAASIFGDHLSFAAASVRNGTAGASIRGGGGGTGQFKRNPVIDIVKTADAPESAIDVRSIVKPVKLQPQQNTSPSSDQAESMTTLSAKHSMSNVSFLMSERDDNNNSRDHLHQQQQHQENEPRRRGYSLVSFDGVLDNSGGLSFNESTTNALARPQGEESMTFETSGIFPTFGDSKNTSAPHQSRSFSHQNNNNPASSSSAAAMSMTHNNMHQHHQLSAQAKRRINPTSGGVGPYAVFDYETFVENFEKTRGAKALAQQLEELKATFKDYVEKSNLDRAGIASSFQFQLDAKDGQIKALRLALLQALGTAPTLASMVRSFMSRVLKIEVDQLKKRMLHLQKAVKTWIDHIQKHVHVMGARFDVFVRFCGNIFQELSDHVTYAVQQRFPLAPGSTYQPPPKMEPLWHFFVLKGDDDPEEEAKAYWQNHEATQSIALLQTNMCEALKEIHFALRLAANLKNPYQQQASKPGDHNLFDGNDNDEMNNDNASNPTTVPNNNNNNNIMNTSTSLFGASVTSSSASPKKKTSSASPSTPRGLKKLVSFSNLQSDSTNNKNDGGESSPSLSGSLRSAGSAGGGVGGNRFPLRKRSPVHSPPRGQHTITFQNPDSEAGEPIQPGNGPSSSTEFGRKRRIKSLYSGTSWEAMDTHREGIEKDFGSGMLLHGGSQNGSFYSVPTHAPTNNPDVLKKLDEWAAQNGNEMFFGASVTSNNPMSAMMASTNNTNNKNNNNNSNSKSNANFGASTSTRPGFAAASVGAGGRRRKRNNQKYDDWTVETSVENIKFLRGLSRRCVQLSVRSILARVHLRARRQLLLRKMSPENRNAYLSVAALDREIAHVSDVIDGSRGNGYLAKFRAVETEHIIQAWKSTGRRGKPVITGDSDEDDSRVLPVHAPGMVPVRSLDTIRGKAEGQKSKDGIQKFRATLGATGGTSKSLDADDADDGTLGDPVKLVQEMISTGTLWSQSSYGKDSKGAYRARQDVLYELIDKETQRMKSSDGFKTRRKRRFLRMLNYLRNKVGFAESAINAARSGTKSTAVEEGTTLLRHFVDRYGVNEEEDLEIDELDPANANYFLSRKANDIQHVRGSAGSFLTNTWGNSPSSSSGNMLNRNETAVFDEKSGARGVGSGGSVLPNASASSHFTHRQHEILQSARSQLKLALAGDGSERWKYSKRDGGAINGTFDSISDTIIRNRSDVLALQRLGLTEEQINLMQIQSLRSKAQRPPADLREFLTSTINMSFEASDANNNDHDDDNDNSDDAEKKRKQKKLQREKTATEVLDEAMEKLRDDLFFGRNQTEIWFGANSELWIPTPGQDMPQEMKDASRDTLLRKAMATLLAIGAISADDENNDNSDHADKNEEETSTPSNKKNQSQNETVPGAGVSITASASSPKDKNNNNTKVNVNFSPAPPSASSPSAAGAASPSRSLQRLGTRTYEVREASVQRTDGDAAMEEAFSTHSLNRAKILESEHSS